MCSDSSGVPASAAARVTELRSLIKAYDAQYYLEDASDVPDAVYDALKDALASLGPPLTRPGAAWTMRSGGAPPA